MYSQNKIENKEGEELALWEEWCCGSCQTKDLVDEVLRTEFLPQNQFCGLYAKATSDSATQGGWDSATTIGRTAYSFILLKKGQVEPGSHYRTCGQCRRFPLLGCDQGEGGGIPVPCMSLKSLKYLELLNCIHSTQ